MYGIIDMHCDTLTATSLEKLISGEAQTQITHQGLKKGGVLLQCFAICTPANAEKPNARGLYSECVKRLCEITEKYKMRRILSAEDVRRAERKEAIGALFAVEGADVLENDVEIEQAYADGVRMLSLTWNTSNAFGGGIKENSQGLTPRGRRLIEDCERLGIIIDVSHANEALFWDIAEVTKKPFIASHSNARAICSNKRNLSDEALLAIKKSGGVAGVNFYPPFLRNEGIATVDDVIRHIEYIASLTGTEHVAIGSDFDGTDGKLPHGLERAELLQVIPERLARLNYSEVQIEAVCGRNAARVMKMCLGGE